MKSKGYRRKGALEGHGHSAVDKGRDELHGIWMRKKDAFDRKGTGKSQEEVQS